jgi:hypothetical protein
VCHKCLICLKCNKCDKCAVCCICYSSCVKHKECQGPCPESCPETCPVMCPVPCQESDSSSECSLSDCSFSDCSFDTCEVSDTHECNELKTCPNCPKICGVLALCNKCSVQCDYILLQPCPHVCGMKNCSNCIRCNKCSKCGNCCHCAKTVIYYSCCKNL